MVATISGKPEHHQNSDLEHVDDPVPGAGVGGVKVPSVGVKGTSSGQPVEGSSGIGGTASATIGGTTSNSVNPNPISPTSLIAGSGGRSGVSGGPAGSSGGTEYTRFEKYIDPFTGEVTYRKVLIKTNSSRHGEKVHERINIGS